MQGQINVRIILLCCRWKEQKNIISTVGQNPTLESIIFNLIFQILNNKITVYLSSQDEVIIQQLIAVLL